MEEIISNNTTNSIVVKEEKSVLSKIWEKLVNLGVAIQEVNVDLTKTRIKVLSVFCPELKPILLPVEEFYKSDSGKKYLEGRKQGFRLAGNILKGETDEAKKQCQEMVESISSESGEKMIDDINGMVKDINSAGGMQK